MKRTAVSGKPTFTTCYSSNLLSASNPDFGNDVSEQGQLLLDNSLHEA